MKKSRGLPIPFLILILAGVISLSSALSSRNPRAGAVRDDSLQIQTVEQERIAEIYFRILSWFSGLMPCNPVPAKANPQPAPQPIKAVPRQHQRPGRIELCALPCDRKVAASKSHALDLN